MRQISTLALLAFVLIAVSLLPIETSETPSFADPLFERLWALRSSASGNLDRWGGEPLLWRVEPYADARDGRRLVQYFDRGRMELTRSKVGDASLLTEGTLALEMTTGEIRLGNDLFEHKDPPAVAIDSGAPDARVATYAGLSGLVGSRAPDRTQASLGQAQPIREWVGSDGRPWTSGAPEPTVAAGYVEQTGHNLPGAFTRLFERSPFGQTSWVEALGYPISEPYWTLYRRENTAVPSLVQVFERRILVYSPSLAPEQQFTMANVGRHYYRWRYGEEPPGTWTGPRAGRVGQDITVPNGFEAGIYAQRLGTPVALAVGPSGTLWVATQQGDVVQVVAESEGGAASKTIVFADHLPNPRGIAVGEQAVYVAVDDGVMELRDTDGDGRADQRAYRSTTIEPSPSPRGALSLDRDGDVLLAGLPLPGREQRQVVSLASDGKQQVLTTALAKPGPVLALGGQVYVVDQRPDGSSYLVLLTMLPDGTAAQVSGPVVEFGTRVTVHALLVPASPLGPGIPSGTIFACVTSGESASLVRTVAQRDGSLPAVEDFATGLERPVALAFGLDGALFVADAGREQIIKIVPSTPSAQ